LRRTRNQEPLPSSFALSLQRSTSNFQPSPSNAFIPLNLSLDLSLNLDLFLPPQTFNVLSLPGSIRRDHSQKICQPRERNSFELFERQEVVVACDNQIGLG